MALATVAADFDEALDVERALAAGVAFGVVFAHFGADRGELLIGEVLDADILADAGGFEDLLRGGRPDAIDIGQRDDDAFFIGDVNPSNTCHILLGFLSLP